MDREEAIRLLKGGIDGIREFNRRRDSGEKLPNLTGADLEKTQLSFTEPELVSVNLSGAKLERANLSGGNLKFANLSRAELLGTNLSGADLQFANLSGALLLRAELRAAKLSHANLSQADLDDGNLCGADLSDANLSEAGLIRVNLSGASLQQAHLCGVDLFDANLSGAKLTEANLNGAKLVAANLSGADLRRTNLSGAKLIGSNLTGADFNRADMSEADVRNAMGLRLDNTFVRHARFDARAKDPWSVLRRGYTGPALLFNLIFLCAFLGVYAAKAAFWISVNRSQQAALALADQLAATHPQLADAFRALEPTLTEHSRELAVWQVLLSMDRGRWLMTLAVALIVYNAVRWLLTRQVAGMRDAEERSGYLPAWVGDASARPGRLPSWIRTASGAIRGEYGGYRWCWLLHAWIARPLLWLAVVSFLWHASHWLSETVYLPK